MRQLIERFNSNTVANACITLPFEQRQKSRLHAYLDDGREVALLLPRGTVLRHGDVLRGDDGLLVRVQAAPEAVSTAYTDDSLSLARACYHLGNRHVPLQIGAAWLRYLQDHVLDDMVQKLGLRLVQEQAPFEPEAGAYAHVHQANNLLMRHSHGH